jgi:hypothetical protein
LSARVNPGVGAPGTGEADGDAEDGGERALDQRLDRLAVRLHLPTGIVRPVIGNGELVALLLIGRIFFKQGSLPGLYAPGVYQTEKILGKVLVDEFRHFKHVDRFFAAKDFLELLVWVDVSFVFHILQIIFLDIRPKFLGHFGTRHWAIADDRSQLSAWLHWLHEFGSFWFRCHFLSPLKRLGLSKC